ncbi:MAG TPA: DinB family protein [Phycisphaerales bacterium]|nr:DinB family protein [Phycisphaerales bacterium]
MDVQTLDSYEAQAGALALAIAGLTNSDLNTLPSGAPGQWTIQQNIFHLLDSDLVASDRMKRMIAEDNPTLIAYDENRFVKILNYDKLDVRAAAELFRLNRKLTASLLRQQPNSAFARSGTHNQRGNLTVEQLVTDYIHHVNHHMEFVRKKRALLGKPMA